MSNEIFLTMQFSLKSVGIIALISSLCTIAILSVYHQLARPTLLIEQAEVKAQQAAHHEMVFSDKMSRRFESAVPNDFITAAKESRMSVVFIEGEGDVTDDTYYARKVEVSTGSGVIISNDGYIVTNNHVIDGSNRLRVTLNDNREYVAKVVGKDAQTDLALLKIEATGLPYLIFGDSDALQIGEWVLAVGNPFRLRSSVTAGIVSAKARNINVTNEKGVEAFIQTDAAVNQGNSGGALIDTRGNLVGINTAILTQSGGYEGFSFAIPANLAKKIVKDLKEYGAVQRGWMGIVINNINAPLAKELGLQEIMGVYINSTNRDGAARSAGLKGGDVIVSINEVKTNSSPEFMEQIGKYSPGDVLSVEYIRDGTKQQTNVTLRNHLNSTDFVAVRKDDVLRDIGLEIRDLDSMEKSKFGPEGIYVVSIAKYKKLGNINMEPGYVITKYNGQAVKDANTFIKWLAEHKGTVVLNGFYENYPGEFPYTFSME